VCVFKAWASQERQAVYKQRKKQVNAGVFTEACSCLWPTCAEYGTRAASCVSARVGRSIGDNLVLILSSQTHDQACAFLGHNDMYVCKCVVLCDWGGQGQGHVWEIGLDPHEAKEKAAVELKEFVFPAFFSPLHHRGTQMTLSFPVFGGYLYSVVSFIVSCSCCYLSLIVSHSFWVVGPLLCCLLACPATLSLTLLPLRMAADAGDLSLSFHYVCSSLPIGLKYYLYGRAHPSLVLLFLSPFHRSLSILWPVQAHSLFPPSWPFPIFLTTTQYVQVLHSFS